jgi:septal ring factor EnvC (AmiA/AmiB activator)
VKNICCVQALDEVKLRELAIVDLQKKIAEAETKFKQQQNVYEAVRVDRNMYSKKLIESQDEISEMKRKFKIMSHQIEQLKDEISAKDMALVKEHFDHLRVCLRARTTRVYVTRLQRALQIAGAAVCQRTAGVHHGRTDSCLAAARPRAPQGRAPTT